MATKTKKPAKGSSKAPVKDKGKTRRGFVGPKLAEITILEHANLGLGEIDPSPYQPRRDFGAEELSELAESMTRQGQIEPIAVRRVEGRYELLAGERRWRAATLAGMTTIRAEVHDCTDAQARQIALAENIHRKALSPIEEAAAYRSMIDAGDVDGPTELARQLGIHQSTVSNRLRLLDLPELWQARVISREITERHARAVLPYLDYPSLMAAFCEAIDKEVEDAGEMPSVAVWEEEIMPQVIRAHTRTMDGEDGTGLVFDSKRGRRVQIFEPTPKQAKALGIVTIKGERRATNEELWNQLQEEFLQRIEAEQQDLGETTPDAPPSADGDDESDENEDVQCEAPLHNDVSSSGREATGKDFAARLWAWKCMFLRYAIAKYLRHQASEADLLKMALLVLWKQDFGSCNESVILAECAKAAGMRPKKDTLGVILVLDDIEAPMAAGAVLASAFWVDDLGPQFDIPAEDLLSIAVSLGVDLEEAWAAGDVPSPQGYWDLHTKEQLLAIAKEVKVLTTLSIEAIQSLPCAKPDGLTFADLEAMRKADLVATLMKAMAGPDDQDAGIPMPKEITKAKQPKK